MHISFSKKKLYMIIAWLIFLSLVWSVTKNSINEKFDDSFLVGSAESDSIIKSFGTNLRDIPEVAEKALLFTAIRPIKRRRLPKAYPSNAMDSKEWQTYLTYLSF